MRCRRPSRREHVVYRVAEPVVNSERQKSGRSGSPRGEGVSLAVNRRRALKSSARASRSSTTIPAVTGCALPSTRRVVRSVSSSVSTASWRWLSAVCKQHTIGSLIGCPSPSTRRAVRIADVARLTLRVVRASLDRDRDGLLVFFVGSPQIKSPRVIHSMVVVVAGHTTKSGFALSASRGVVGQWGGGAGGAVCEDHRPVTGGALSLAACSEKKYRPANKTGFLGYSLSARAS